MFDDQLERLACADEHYRGSGLLPATVPFVSSRGITQVPYAAVGGHAVFEGDIVLGRLEDYLMPDAVASRKARRRFQRWPRPPRIAPRSVTNDGSEFQWPNDTMPYEVDDDLPEPLRDEITRAAAHWNQNTLLRLVQRQGDFEGAKDYVRFDHVGDDDKCSSDGIGNQGGKKKISLGDECGGTVLHEVGHAVGLFHEQTRHDRDEHLIVCWDNIDGDRKDQYKKCEERDDYHCHDRGDFDWDSVMLYPWYFFRKDDSELPTMKKRKNCPAAGQSCSSMDCTYETKHEPLSEGDIGGVTRMVTVEAAPSARVVASMAADRCMDVQSDGDVVLRNCIPGRQEQRWYWFRRPDLYGEFLINAANAMCLTAPGYRTGKFKVKPCGAGNGNQRFIRGFGLVRPVNTDECVGVDPEKMGSGSPVYAVQCTTGPLTLWAERDEGPSPPGTTPSTTIVPATTTTTTTLRTVSRPVITSMSPAYDAVVPTNQPTLTVTVSGRPPYTYHFSVERPGVGTLVSGDLHQAQWQVPASQLDPATRYEWTACVRDATTLQTCSRSRFRVQFMPVAAEMVATPDGSGYWTVDTRGAVRTFGDSARHFGDLPSSGVAVQNVIGLARTADGGGYWLVGSDGGVFAFGNAQFYGSMGGQPLNRPVVGMTPTPDGLGYWLVADDGGVFAFGNARFFGSMGGQPLSAPVVAMAATKDGGGYWLVAADGGIFSFGNAGFFGSMGGQHLNRPVTDMAAHPSSAGYWLVAEDGGIFTFGAAQFHGTPAGYALAGRIVAMETTPDGGGYWLLGCDGGIFAYGNAPFFGADPVHACRGIPGAPWPPAPPPGDPMPPILAATRPTCEDHNACTDDAHTFAAGCTHRLAPRCMTPILGLLLDGVCGDAVIDVGEACDDGNIRSGDCCSATCTFEPAGSQCGNGCEAKTCSGAGACTR